MSPARYIAYLRVSRERQGQSGLGLEAQRKAVRDYIAQRGGSLLCEYHEVESGKKCDRPELDSALMDCRHTGAVLIVAKLDRLTRDAAFFLKLYEDLGEGGVAFCDFPQFPTGPAGKFMLTMLAAVAEFERGMISQRTKAALAAAKARGVKLGTNNLPESSRETARRANEASQRYARERAIRIAPYIHQARKAGAGTYDEIAKALEARGIKTPGGRTNWSPTQVARVLERAGA